MRLLFLASFGFDKPAATQLLGWNAGKVGFDVEDWSAVEHVNPAYMEIATVPPQERKDGQPNRIGVAW